MKLKVTWRDAQASHDILVTADATATAGDLAGVLAGVMAGGPAGELAAAAAAGAAGAGLGGTAGAGLGAAAPARTLRVIDAGGRTGQPLPERVTLVDSGLRSGTLLELATAREGSREAGAAAAVLRILDGPDAGIEVGLPLGESSIGRSSDCYVRLNDPMVSKHHARVLVSDRVEVIDDNSSNGVIVGGTRIARIQLGPGDIMVIGGTQIAVTQIVTAAAATSTDVSFVRSPRVVARPVESTVDLPEAPAAPDPLSFPWLAMVAPLAMGAVMMTTMPTARATSLLFVALSPLLMVGTYITQRAQSKRRHKAAIANFTAELAQFQSELEADHHRDREILLALHPSVAQCVGAVASLNDILWSRRPEHPGVSARPARPRRHPRRDHRSASAGRWDPGVCRPGAGHGAALRHAHRRSRRRGPALGRWVGAVRSPAGPGRGGPGRGHPDRLVALPVRGRPHLPDLERRQDPVELAQVAAAFDIAALPIG